MFSVLSRTNFAHFEQFHLLPQCFPKAFIFSVLKLVYMEERVNTKQEEPTLDRSQHHTVLLINKLLWQNQL